jgi:two-component system nitrogen regulation response regulator GlnG
LPPELTEPASIDTSFDDWEQRLRQWVEFNLMEGETELLNNAVPRFEAIMIEAALKCSGGRRQDAAKLLGWGRNTLTRKIRSLGLEL